LKDKILFYIDSGLIHFGIANRFLANYDCDIFAIIDVGDKEKKFFQQQHITNFKKVWYYLDHVSKIDKNHDLEYLKDFEIKNKINLWSIAYVDRYFVRKYNTLYKFKEHEILSILEQECKFFEKILDEVQPNFLALSLTDLHHNHLLYKLCMSKGIKILMLSPIKFGHKKMISEEYSKVDFIEKKEKIMTNSKSIEELRSYLNSFDPFKQVKEYQKYGFESNRWKRYKGILQFFFGPSSASYKNHYSNYGRTRFKVFFQKLSRSLKRKIRENFINKNFSKNIDSSTPFIYYPLSHEPERSSLIEAPFFTDQIAFITSIAKSIPVGYHLYVKEHFAMKILGWRNISYYKQIQSLPNVKLIHPSVKPDKILEKSSLVITISGTASLEAAFYGKPSIIVSDLGFSSLSSVTKIDRLEDLPQTIRELLQTKVNPKELSEYVELMDANSFEANTTALGANFANRFILKGPVIDSYLPTSEIEAFLNDHKSIFEILANEHIKKIKQHKTFDNK